MSTEDRSTAVNSRRRWRLLAGVGGAVLTVALVYGLYWAQVLRWHQTTDDAYVSGNVVEITPQISGTVVGIGADDTQFVKAGQPLVRLDHADARVALDQAEAQLARTVREVRNQFATSAQLEAAVEVKQTALTAAQSDLTRREQLGASGAVSGEELQHARDAMRAAQADLNATRQQFAANRARIDGTTLADHPEVRDAAAAVRNAYLTWARTELPAPVAGFVARRSVQLGQRVSPGTTLMAVVPLDQVWVDANFKEPQLASMRVGQPVRLSADLYGSRVVFHGRVAGFGAGTGARGARSGRAGRTPAANRAVDARRRRCSRQERRAAAAAREHRDPVVDGGVRLERYAGRCTRRRYHQRQRGGPGARGRGHGERHAGPRTARRFAAACRAATRTLSLRGGYLRSSE
jgi:membrane fusion protein, multidrug efflux system